MKETFEKFGDVFLKVHQEGDWYIYERTPKEWYGTGDRRHWEVVKPMKTNLDPNRYTGKRPDGYKYIYPSTSKWGKLGFTFKKYENAMKKIKALQK